jgi:hypothetical protein
MSRNFFFFNDRKICQLVTRCSYSRSLRRTLIRRVDLRRQSLIDERRSQKRARKCIELDRARDANGAADEMMRWGSIR